MSKDAPTLQRHASNREGEDLAEPLPKDLDLHKAKIIMYGFDLSPPCIKVRALLSYYGVKYELIKAMPAASVDGLDNSYRKVPKLLIDDRQINDSAVIFRSLAPFLTGSPLTAAQIELEKDNNVKGLMGALELETATSYFGIVRALQGYTADSQSTAFKYLVRPWMPYAVGFLAPLPWTITKFATPPHGRDGSAVSYGHKYAAALGDAKFFHGKEIGPVDLSIYGTLKLFVDYRTPAAMAVLDAGLSDWFGRMEEAFKSKEPIFV